MILPSSKCIPSLRPKWPPQKNRGGWRAGNPPTGEPPLRQRSRRRRARIRKPPRSNRTSRRSFAARKIILPPCHSHGMSEASSESEQDTPEPQPANLKPHASAFAHDVFDSMSQSMARATTFDLGSFALERKFDAFDAKLNRSGRKKPDATPAYVVPQSTAETFAEDLDLMRGGLPSASALANVSVSRAQNDAPVDNPNWPPRPPTLRLYTLAEKRTAFGQFQYEADPSTASAFSEIGARNTSSQRLQKQRSLSVGLSA